MSKKSHILFIAGWYPSRVTPDSGDFIQRHAQAISSLHKVSVIHVKSDKKATQKLEIVEKDEGSFTSRIAYIKPSGFSLMKAYQFITAFLKLIKIAGDYDLVHVNKLFPSGLMALYLKIVKGKVYIISEHYHAYYRKYRKKISFFEKILSKIIVKQAAVVCPVSESLRQAMQNFGLPGNYKVVPNVVSTDIFKPANKKTNTFQILHVSNMSVLKHVPEIIKAVAKFQETYPNSVLNLVGRGSIKFSSYAKKFGMTKEQINFIDQISQKDLASYYQRAHVVLMFSEIETFSIVTFEAFACGTPVITTRVGGIVENFQKDYGYLIDKNDEKQLINSLLKLAKEFQKPPAEEMYQFVKERFSVEVITHKFSTIYHQILAKK